MESVLLCEHLSKTYATPAGPLTVLRDVSLEVKGGQSCAIVGPSGSGKTTLLALAAGLDRPSQGRVALVGCELASLREDAIARHRNRYVGFIFQNYQLVPSLSALENIALPLELLAQQGRREIRDRAHSLLEQVGLGGRADHLPSQLSGGEQQRVALARAFVTEPQILFADEPTGSLDAENADRAWDLMHTLNERSKTALVLVTHDEQLARRLQRIVRLRHGEIVSC